MKQGTRSAHSVPEPVEFSVLNAQHPAQCTEKT